MIKKISIRRSDFNWHKKETGTNHSDLNSDKVEFNDCWVKDGKKYTTQHVLSEIHPCPICGGPMEIAYNNAMVYWLYCNTCDLSRDLYFGSETDAVVSWNKLFEKES